MNEEEIMRIEGLKTKSYYSLTKEEKETLEAELKELLHKRMKFVESCSKPIGSDIVTSFSYDHRFELTLLNEKDHYIRRSLTTEQVESLSSLFSQVLEVLRLNKEIHSFDFCLERY